MEEWWRVGTSRISPLDFDYMTLSKNIDYNLSCRVIS
jgi:hypothetical protein